MEKIKLGVFGLGRGRSLFSSMLAAGAEIVAVCEINERRIEEAKKIAKEAREKLKTLCPALVQRAANS